MSRRQQVPNPFGQLPGFVFRNRLAYLGSNASLVSLPFSTEWANTSNAVRLLGRWDSQAGSADVSYAFPISYAGAGITPTLFFQYRMPAWDDINFLNDKYDGMMMASPQYTGNYGGPTLAAKWQYTSGVVTGGNQMYMTFFALYRVFDSNNNLKYEMSLPFAQSLYDAIIGGSGLALSYTLGDVSNGTNSIPSFTNVQAITFNNSMRVVGLTAAPGDYVVVEIGGVFFARVATSGTFSARMGDAHSFDNLGLNGVGGGVQTDVLGPTPANGCVMFQYRSAA